MKYISVVLFKWVNCYIIAQNVCNFKEFKSVIYITLIIIVLFSHEYFLHLHIRFSMEDMYDVVSNVDKYQEFVPWCMNSDIKARKDGHFKASLEIGFPPLVERYSSTVTVVKPRLVAVSY